jgi:hypothetical protein
VQKARLIFQTTGFHCQVEVDNMPLPALSRALAGIKGMPLSRSGLS